MRKERACLIQRDRVLPGYLRVPTIAPYAHSAFRYIHDDMRYGWRVWGWDWEHESEDK